MIAFITGGRGLRSALAYDLEPRHGEPDRATWVAGTLSGTPRQMSRQAAALRGLRPDIAAPVWRCSLSLPPSDGRRTAEFWQKIATEFLIEMGVNTEKAAWCAVHHDDRAHSHVHITLIRCQADGSLFDRANDVMRAIKTTQILEQRHQLSAHSRDPPARSKPSLLKQETPKRTGKPVSKIHIQEKIDRFVELKNGAQFSLAELQNALSIDHIDLTDVRTQKGKLQGLSFKFDNVAMPASALGSDYSTKGMITRGLQIAEVRAAEAAALEEKKNEKARKDDRAPVKEDRQDRRPAMLRRQLQPFQTAHPAAAMNLAKTDRQIADAPIGPLSKVMLVIGMTAIKLGVEAVRALLNFIKWLLRKVGIDLSPAEPGSAQAQTVLPFEPRYLDVESRVIADPKISSDIESVAKELEQVAGALEKNDPDLLPEGQGRAELAAAMMATPAVPPAREADQENKKDWLIEAFATSPVAASPTPAELVDAAMGEFKKTVEALRDADSRAQAAPKVMADEVQEARQKLAVAEKRLARRQADHAVEKADAPRLLKFAFPSVKSFCAKEITVVDAAKSAQAAAEAAHPARVPQDLSTALLQARIGAVRAGGLAVAAQKKMLATLENGDPDLFKFAKYQVSTFAAQADLLAKLPLTAQAEATVKNGFNAIENIARKQVEIEEAAKKLVRDELENASWKTVPQNFQSENFERPQG